MSKHSGLSQLADVATEMISPAFAHYPVRRKGARRRLNPNTDGIAWLEGEDFLEATQIVETGIAHEGLQVKIARGWYAAKKAGNYVRPMFQVFKMTSSSSASMAYTPCPACDDWSRTSKCETHHDRDGVDGLSMGTERGRDERAHTAHASMGVRSEDLVGQIATAIDRMVNVSIEVNGETLQGAVSLQFETTRGDGRGPETVTYRF